MSSVSTTAITSDSKQRYQIDFKILAIDLKEEDEHKDNLSITVRFADKCFTIKPGDVSEDEGRSRGESSRSTKSSRSSSRSSKKSDNLPSRGSVNDANDEFSNVSGARSKESRKSKTRKSENCKDTSQAPGNVSIFGSKTICYESSPTSLSEKMANHCIKYEILNCGHLIATTNQLLSDCFAKSIRTENFTGDNINMRLVLLNPENKDTGSMDVCLITRKIER